MSGQQIRKALVLSLFFSTACHAAKLARRLPAPAVPRLKLSPSRAPPLREGSGGPCLRHRRLPQRRGREVTGRAVLEERRSGCPGRRRGSDRSRVRRKCAGPGQLRRSDHRKCPVTVSRASEPERLSFRYDVLPVLDPGRAATRGIHGNAEGKGGFKLSLKAEDPEWDYDVIARYGGVEAREPRRPGEQPAAPQSHVRHAPRRRPPVQERLAGVRPACPVDCGRRLLRSADRSYAHPDRGSPP